MGCSEHFAQGHVAFNVVWKPVLEFRFKRFTLRQNILIESLCCAISHVLLLPNLYTGHSALKF